MKSHQTIPRQESASTLAESVDTSPTICHCHGITEKEILDTIENHDTPTVDTVSRATGACTGCTGCHCRIERLVQGKPAACGAFALCQGCGCCLAICGCTEECEVEKRAEKASESSLSLPAEHPSRSPGLFPALDW